MASESSAVIDAKRYAKLKQWLLTQQIVFHVELSDKDSEPFVMGKQFFGPTFEAAVDSL